MKKGFTLVELLAVIVLLGGILTLAMTLLTGQIRDKEEELKDAEFKTYCSAAKLYINKNWTISELKLKTLEENSILTNLDEEHKNKSIYVGYIGNYYCCCKDLSRNNCNNDICEI